MLKNHRSDHLNDGLCTEVCKHEAAFLVQSVVVCFRADVYLTVGCVYCYRQQVHHCHQLWVVEMVQFLILTSFMCCQARNFQLRPDISSLVSSSFFSLSFCRLSSCWTPSDDWLHQTSLSDFDQNAWLLSPDNCYIGPVTDVQYSRATDVIATCLSVGWSVCMCTLLCVFPVCVFAE